MEKSEEEALLYDSDLMSDRDVKPPSGDELSDDDDDEGEEDDEDDDFRNESVDTPSKFQKLASTEVV